MTHTPEEHELALVLVRSYGTPIDMARAATKAGWVRSDGVDLDAVIKAAKAEALRAAAREIIPAGIPEDVTTISDPYDVSEWLNKRASEIAGAK